MTATKHEGLYYRKNKRNKKVFYARFKINKKAYLRKLGEEPDMSTSTAHLARIDMIVKMKGGTVTNSKTIDQLFDEYVESRRLALSDSWYYGINRNYEKHLKNLIGKMFPQEVKSQDIQKIINDMLQGNNEKKKKYKPSTVKQIKDCMSGLYDYLKKSGIDVRNIGRELVIPSFDNKIYFTISDEKAQKLFDVILNSQLSHVFKV